MTSTLHSCPLSTQAAAVCRSLPIAVLALVCAPPSQAIPSPVIPFGSYVSHQVNVDSDGHDIVGDKGNEPSIAVNPLNSSNVVIGWRKFDAPATSVKHGGTAYSLDGGASWSVGQLPALAGQSRTDPSLATDSEGTFYYQSLGLGGSDQTSVFKSYDGGATWSEPAFQFHGDKNWIAIDQSGGPSDGHIYSTWRRTSLPNPDPNYVPKYFIRSTDRGVSYQEPDAALPVASFGFGRIAIGPEGQVYLSGVDETASGVNALGVVRSGHYMMKSVDARNPTTPATFTAQKVDLGGNPMMFVSQFLDTPNPLGADGDVQVATDRSLGPGRGNIYLMAQVTPYGWQAGSDPQDVRFIRSTDGGTTWSAPIRLNDDHPSATAYQWFPMLDVAPNGRIDAVWYDTRNGTEPAPYRWSQLYYSYSWDGGQTWSPNRAVTPAFNTHLPYNTINGLERQGDKMGDYTQLISDEEGAHIAYTATYLGEQNVYYLKAFPDCNDSGISDVGEIAGNQRLDRNSNHILDRCEGLPDDRYDSNEPRHRRHRKGHRHRHGGNMTSLGVRATPEHESTPTTTGYPHPSPLS